MTKYLDTPTCVGHWWFLPEDKLPLSHLPTAWSVVFVDDTCPYKGIFVGPIDAPTFKAQEVVNRPTLPKDTRISYNDIKATVVSDTGNKITVTVDGSCYTEEWEWICEGTECQVISFPKTISKPM